jgi:hypothetical protein
VNRAPGTNLPIAQEDAGTVVPHPERILSFDISSPDLSIGDFEMASDTVYIGRIQIESRSLEPVAAITGAIIAEHRVACVAVVVGRECVMHDISNPI